MTTFITGHEVEIAEIEKQAASPEARALTMKLSGEQLALHGETLRLAAIGQLAPITENIFGMPESVADQVETAETMFKRHLEILTRLA